MAGEAGPPGGKDVAGEAEAPPGYEEAVGAEPGADVWMGAGGGFSGYDVASSRTAEPSGPPGPDSASASLRSSTAADGRADGSRTSTLISTSRNAPARTGGGTSSWRTAARVARVFALRSGWWPSTAL